MFKITNFLLSASSLLYLTACMQISPGQIPSSPSEITYEHVATPDDADILFLPMIGGGTVTFSLNTTASEKNLCSDFKAANITTTTTTSRSVAPTRIPVGQPISVSASFQKQGLFGAGCDSAPVILFIPQKGEHYQVGFARGPGTETSTCVITVEINSKREIIDSQRFKSCLNKTQ